jgi:hypothetical protein
MKYDDRTITVLHKVWRDFFPLLRPYIFINVDVLNSPQCIYVKQT